MLTPLHYKLYIDTYPEMTFTLTKTFRESTPNIACWRLEMYISGSKIHIANFLLEDISAFISDLQDTPKVWDEASAVAEANEMIKAIRLNYAGSRIGTSRI